MTHAWDASTTPKPTGPPTDPKLSARETWRALSIHIRPHRALITLGGLLGLLGSAMTLAQPLVTTAMVDALENDESITAVLGLLSALILLGTVVQTLGRYVLERTDGQRGLGDRRSSLRPPCQRSS
ncbi:ABC transporter ATP-binding protein [Streptomyces sp. SAJ15]|uniref:ABC transporter ATP-binding protein n=1 Tax=Streptomyces sp. SAJ15 TaxID=2011095 RepID=UPI00118536FA|nr:ABC transporter ATP-binding protein [Streptomyces sp. SAJ15]TVL90272.1 hypothetical protein CD790_22440 [Streptomyces sp. SAJ15]